jgi:hypothetical protein
MQVGVPFLRTITVELVSPIRLRNVPHHIRGGKGQTQSDRLREPGQGHRQETIRRHDRKADPWHQHHAVGSGPITVIHRLLKQGPFPGQIEIMGTGTNTGRDHRQARARKGTSRMQHHLHRVEGSLDLRRIVEGKHTEIQLPAASQLRQPGFIPARQHHIDPLLQKAPGQQPAAEPGGAIEQDTTARMDDTAARRSRHQVARLNTQGTRSSMKSLSSDSGRWP